MESQSFKPSKSPVESASITVVICTYRRNRLLRKCLSALLQQTVERDFFSILVVDNACCDRTKELCFEFEARYVKEEKIGISFARNRGVNEAEGEWIFFLDDDAIPYRNLISNFITIIQDPAVQVVGGKYCHYFEEPPPGWLLCYYNKCYQVIDTDVISIVPPGKYLSIGIMAVKKSLALRTGKFDTSLGMTGGSFGYGEEDEFQDRVRTFGIPVYFSPDLVMDHLVSPRKYTIRSRIKMAYAHGYASTSLAEQGSFSYGAFIKITLRITFVTVPYDLGRFLFRPGFYWQNSVVSILTKYAFTWGQIRSKMRINTR